MKATNFFQNAPPWVNNSLAAILTLLLTIDQIAPYISELFGIIDCQPCISYLQKALSIVAVILSVLKIFMKAEPKMVYDANERDNQSGRIISHKKPLVN